MPVVNWTEDEYAQLLKKQGKGTKGKRAAHRKKGVKVAVVPEPGTVVKRKPGPAKGSLQGDQIQGDPMSCPDCGAKWDDTETCSGTKNRWQWTEMQGGVSFDKFKCLCLPPHKYDRYK